MKPGLQLRLGQQLTLTPQLQQAIRLLQLSTLELDQVVQQTLDSNIMLEMDENNNAKAETQSAADVLHDKSAEIDKFSIFSDASQTKVASRVKRSDFYAMEIEDTQATKTTLRDHLYWQMNLTPFTETDKIIATAIIDAIREDGFLQGSLIDLLESVPSHYAVGLEEIEIVLHQIQNFEPAGIAARNLRECLLLQLRQLPKETPYLQEATAVIMHHTELLGKRDYGKIKRLYDLSDIAFNQVMELIKKLNPRPGNAVNAVEPDYITPDVLVRKQGNEWVALINEDTIPKLRINSEYMGFIERGNKTNDNLLLRNHLYEARWFIKSIQSRYETLLKVAECIVESQQAFFEQGEEAMKPLVLHHVAEKMGLHESTVSRITTQKYMHTPRGIFELKYFFSSHVSTQSGGECSSTAIRALIKKFVAAEDRQKPLSDSRLAQLLASQGLNVARRTVAKYRESLQIPASNERKSWV